MNALAGAVAAVVWTALFYVFVFRYVWPWDLVGRRRELKIKHERRW